MPHRGNWGVDLQAGSQFGYKLLFVVLLAGLFAIWVQVSLAPCAPLASSLTFWVRRRHRVSVALQVSVGVLPSYMRLIELMCAQILPRTVAFCFTTARGISFYGDGPHSIRFTCSPKSRLSARTSPSSSDQPSRSACSSPAYPSGLALSSLPLTSCSSSHSGTPSKAARFASSSSSSQSWFVPPSWRPYFSDVKTHYARPCVYRYL